MSAIGAPTHDLPHLATKLQPFVGAYYYFVKYSSHFIQISKTTHIDPNDNMVSFYVISHSTKIPIPETLKLISNFIEPETLSFMLMVLDTANIQGVSPIWSRN